MWESSWQECRASRASGTLSFVFLSVVLEKQSPEVQAVLRQGFWDPFRALCTGTGSPQACRGPGLSLVLVTGQDLGQDTGQLQPAASFLSAPPGKARTELQARSGSLRPCTR